MSTISRELKIEKIGEYTYYQSYMSNSSLD
jgi:hypothetical protein